jgi:hypothetical protein
MLRSTVGKEVVPVDKDEKGQDELFSEDQKKYYHVIISDT